MGAAEEANRLNEENARLRDEIDKVLRERDEARAAEEHLRGQHQYSIGLSMALEERDQARRERDLALGRLENEIKAANQARMAEERARESLDELDAAIYECLPSDYDDDSPLDCVEHAADRLRDLAQERDEHKAKREEYAAEARSLRERLKDAYRERDEARAELATLADALDDIRHQRDRYHVELKQERAEVERLRAEAERWKRSCNVFRERDWPHAFQVTVTSLERELDEARAEVEHWRVKAEAYGGMVDGCGPALGAAGHPIDPFQPDGRVGGIARSVAALIKERDEARAEVDALRSQIERLRGALHIVSLDEYESTSSASEKVHAHARQARIVLNETLAGVTPSDAAHVASLENLFLKACKRAEKWETASKDAYRRGAEAMREACAQAVSPDPKWTQALYDSILRSRAEAIRALPVPEET